VLSEGHPKLLSAVGRREIWLSSQASKLISDLLTSRPEQFSWCAAFRGTTGRHIFPFPGTSVEEGELD